MNRNVIIEKAKNKYANDESCRARARAFTRSYYQRQKLQALGIVSKSETPICANCGCNFIEILELNHKNGGGTKENLRSYAMYRAVITGRRTLEDLEVLCKVCNTKDHVKRAFGIDFNIECLGRPRD